MIPTDHKTKTGLAVAVEKLGKVIANDHLFFGIRSRGTGGDPSSYTSNRDQCEMKWNE
jgi:hypothetical protein